MNQALKLVILGRDGILNEYCEDHIKSPQEWTAVPGALPAVARLNHAGWHVVVATNQSGIGRGMIDMAMVNAVHAHMMRELQAVGGRIDAVFFCPHAPAEACDCRKPLPGMMRDVAHRYGVHLADVPMVADTERDVLAAQAAGCEPHLVCTGRAAALDATQIKNLQSQVPQLQIHADLSAFAEHLLAREPGPGSQREDLS